MPCLPPTTTSSHEAKVPPHDFIFEHSTKSVNRNDEFYTIRTEAQTTPEEQVEAETVPERQQRRRARLSQKRKEIELEAQNTRSLEEEMLELGQNMQSREQSVNNTEIYDEQE